MKNNMPERGGMDLIIYQIAEVKNLLENMNIKQDSFNDKIDKRVSALELWQAGEMERSKRVEKDNSSNLFGMDIGKIVIAALGIVATALALLSKDYFK
jgi:hypothetical protein